jgi:hypothetical protein
LLLRHQAVISGCAAKATRYGLGVEEWNEDALLSREKKKQRGGFSGIS